MDDCLSRLSALLLSSLVEAESSGASANFSRLRLTDDALPESSESLLAADSGQFWSFFNHSSCRSLLDAANRY